MKRSMAVALLLVCLVLTCLGNTESLTNNSKQVMSGVVITFSERVQITGYDQTIFPTHDPSGRAEVITFGGGALARAGRFRVSWVPGDAVITGVSWIVKDKEQADADYQAGADAYGAGEPTQAIQSLMVALDLYRGLRDRLNEGGCLFYIGLCFDSLSEYRTAMDYYEEALAVFLELDARPGEAMSLNNLGNCYYSLSDYHKSIDCHERSLAIRRELSDRAGEAMSLNNLGNCYYSLADYRRAIESFEQAMLMFQELKSTGGQAMCLNNLGLCYWAQGDYDRAIENHERSLASMQQSDDQAGEAMCLNNLGNCYTSLGDYRRAIDYHEQSMAIRRDLQDRAGEAMSLDNLGFCYWSLGDYDRAIEYHEQALAIRQSIADREGAAASLNNLGNCYFSLADYPKAAECYEAARPVFHEFAARAGEATSLNNLGLCSWSLGKYGEAIDYHEQSFAIRQEIGDKAGQAMSLNNLGDCYSSQGDWPTAAHCYDQALAAVRALTSSQGYSTGLPEALWRIQSGLAECRRALGDLYGAVSAWQEAVTVIEDMRARVGTASFTPSFMRKKFFVYDELVPSLLDIGEPEEGMQYAERAKARTLVDMMETAMITRAEILPPRMQSGSGLARAIGAANVGQSESGEPMSSRSGTQAATEWTQTQYEAFLSELRDEDPALGDTLSVSPSRIQDYCEDVQARLDQSIVLEYFVADEETILWVITEDGIQTASRISVARADLMSMVSSFRESVQVAPLDPAYPIVSYYRTLQEAKPLYDLLIAPVEACIAGAKHLIIVPSDILFYVPFAALYQCADGFDLYSDAVVRCAGDPRGAQSVGKFLIERFDVSYAPSLASLYWPLHNERGSTYGSILAVGNPTGDLAAAQAEATAVAELFPDSTLLLREKGTEAKVKEELASRGYDVVHLSTHGVFDRDMPLLSKVVLCAGEGEDGQLYAGEILGLPLSRTKLVILSACQTALPPEVSRDLVAGDEIQGLGQALFVAGVPSAALTLWNVDDASTGELTIEFYESLMSGGQKAEALASAQRSLRDGAHGLTYSHPY
jgi:CHAT domain-containing protein/tetratricopeptide (TPR) repeat protein